MTDDEAQLLAPPAGYHNLEQTEQVLEEFPVDLDLLLRALWRSRCPTSTDVDLPTGSGFLF